MYRKECVEGNSTLKRLLFIVSPVLLVWFITGCGADPLSTVPDDESHRIVFEKEFEAITQKIFLSKLTPETGDTLTIRSVISNHGDLIDVESRICGLNIETDMEWEYAGPDCDGYSVSGPFAEGAERETWQSMVITSKPGIYQLKIQHILDPEFYATVDIEVR